MLRKNFISVLVLSLFVLPVFALATNTTSVSVNSSYYNYSEQELLALIAKLQAQLAELRNNVTPCNLADVDLSIGDGEGGVNKEYVKNLQSFLKEKGYFSIEPTGWFGKITRASLVSFQTASGLTATGELDSATRAYIKTLSCRKIYPVYKNEVKSEIKTEIKTPAVAPAPVSSINLISNGTSVKWSTVGYSKNGFKIVWSKNPNPTYPTRSGDKYIYLSDPSAYYTSLEAFDGAGTYYVRVCEYTGVCAVYSNEVTVSLGGGTTSSSAPVSSISLTGTGSSVSWVTTGYSKSGFKIVWSKNPNPTYPTRSGDQYIYLSEPGATSTNLNAFSGEGTYYVRVCEYTGVCGTYSNEITVSL